MTTDPAEISDELGYTHLQADIFDRLRRAGIPDPIIGEILWHVAKGEQARQSLEDARAIDALAARGAQ